MKKNISLELEEFLKTKGIAGICVEGFEFGDLRKEGFNNLITVL